MIYVVGRAMFAFRDEEKGSGKSWDGVSMMAKGKMKPSLEEQCQMADASCRDSKKKSQEKNNIFDKGR